MGGPTERIAEKSGFVQRDETALSYVAFLRESPAVVLVIVHGLSEHKGRYLRLQNELARQGLSTYAYDQRGFGRSDGLRTHVERYADLLLDLKTFIGFVRGQHPGSRVVVLAHSFGGAVASCFCIDYPEEVDGLVLSAPAYDVPSLPLRLHLLGYLLNHFLPSRLLAYPSEGKNLSRDPEIEIAFKNDPLVQSRGTPRFYVEFRKMNRRIHDLADRIAVPTLILQGSGDRIVLPEGAGALFDRIGAADKKIVWYEGFYHEVFNEVGRERVIADLMAWLKERFN